MKNDIETALDELLVSVEGTNTSHLTAQKPVHAETYTAFKNSKDRKKQLQRWLKGKPAPLKQTLKQALQGFIISALCATGFIAAIMFLNISYLLPMTIHYDAIAKAADEDARQRRQLESTIAETARKLTSLEQRYQLTLSRILAFSEAKQKIDQIIRLVEISDAVLLKADYHTQPLTQIPGEDTETELFTHHLQLHLHMPFHHWQQIKQLIFEHTPQIQLKSERISSADADTEQDLLNLLVEFTLPSVS